MYQYFHIDGISIYVDFYWWELYLHLINLNQSKSVPIVLQKIMNEKPNPPKVNHWVLQIMPNNFITDRITEKQGTQSQPYQMTLNQIKKCVQQLYQFAQVGF